MRGPTVIDQLRAIQRAHGYLPAAELRQLSHRSHTPLYQLQGLASFYPHFRLQPPPAIEVQICDDLSCHLGGAPALVRDVEARVGGDGPGRVPVRSTSCLGQCDRAPAGSVNGAIVTRLTADALISAIHMAAVGERLPPPAVGDAEVPLRIDPYGGKRAYAAVRRLLVEGDRDGTLAALKASGLRGMGGAGFATSLKWEIVRNAPGYEKYVICNADESEPGTIKDRALLERVPHLVVEGMIVAGVVTGAQKGIVYIRHEYEAQAELLEREIVRCRDEGLLGPDLLGASVSFDLSIFVSPGGYICGEESALLEALEGKRAEPRNKPPFPGTHGLYGQPTVINNVETFALVPLILVNGPAWFRAQGRSEAPGLKFVAVTGDVVRPGVYEIPLGAPARDVITDRAGGVAGGRPLKAFAPSGCSSGFLPAAMADVPLEFSALARAGSMLGSGAIVVCAEGRCMLDLALNAVRFFKNESCGKCVPCRVGSAKMVDILTGISRGEGRPEDLLLIGELSEAMILTSICGLGQVVPNPIKSVLTHFPSEIQEHIERQRCPSGVCQPGPARPAPGIRRM
jgi:formate dehydrogenase beta subunit